MTRIIDDLLARNCISTRHVGYFYFHTAVIMAYYDPNVLHRITKTLYPAVAEKYGTTPAGVERAMSHALKCAWEYDNVELKSMTQKKPTNRGFIAYITDAMVYKMIKTVSDRDGIPYGDIQDKYFGKYIIKAIYIYDRKLKWIRKYPR